MHGVLVVVNEAAWESQTAFERVTAACYQQDFMGVCLLSGCSHYYGIGGYIRNLEGTTMGVGGVGVVHGGEETELRKEKLGSCYLF